MRDAEVHVWWVDLDEPPKLASPQAVLAPEELAHGARLRRPVDAQRFLRARVAVRTMLARYADAAPGALAFDRTCGRCGGAHGKPRLLNAPRVRFNASRAGSLLALAVSLGHEVGVDVEARERARDMDLVAGASFAPGERAALAGKDTAAMVDAFLDAWTCKEAYLKLRGLGLVAPLDRIDTSGWRDDEPLADPLEPGAPTFSVRRFRIGPEHVGAAAASNPPVEWRIGPWLP